jgi:hypothetical protein
MHENTKISTSTVKNAQFFASKVISSQAWDSISTNKSAVVVDTCDPTYTGGHR